MKKLIFFCNEDDWFTRSQILTACERIEGLLGIDEQKFLILCKPRRKRSHPSTNETKLITKTLAVLTKLFRLTPSQLSTKLSNRYIFYKSKKHVLSEKKYKVVFVEKANSEKVADIFFNEDNPYVIFVHFDEIIKPRLLGLCVPFNLHSGLLPEFRGCQPLYWQISEKVPLAALTLHRMTEGLDEGDIIVEVPFDLLLDKSPSEHMVQNYRENVLANTLFLGVRRLFKFDKDFGIAQANFSGKARYFNRPVY